MYTTDKPVPLCAQHERCAQGSPVKLGQQLRLQHLVTRRWLHSHHFASPLTNNQEVSHHGNCAVSMLSSTMFCRLLSHGRGCGCRRARPSAVTLSPRPPAMPMQVSAFGDDKSTDTGDVWTLHGYNTKNRFWERDADVEFRFAND